MADVDDRLWATPLEEQRRRDAEAEPVEPEVASEPEPEPVEPESEPQPAAPAPRANLRPLVPIGVFALVIGIALAGLDRGSLGLTTTLDSEWTANQEMRCDTARFEERGRAVTFFGSRQRAVEIFTCHTTGDRKLTPGYFPAAAAPWKSDVTRASARDSRIVIARDGTLTGWAVY